MRLVCFVHPSAIAEISNALNVVYVRRCDLSVAKSAYLSASANCYRTNSVSAVRKVALYKELIICQHICDSVRLCVLIVVSVYRRNACCHRNSSRRNARRCSCYCFHFLHSSFFRILIFVVLLLYSRLIINSISRLNKLNIQLNRFSYID